MDILKREESDQKAFDQAMEEHLTSPLEKLRMVEHDWTKFDRPCPPNNSYVYAVQLLGDVRGKRVLDYGCGDGYLSAILAKRGGLLWGFDTSGKSIEVAKRRAIANRVDDRVQLEQMSCYKLNYEDGKFDLIIGLGVLHHINISSATEEIVRVLKNGGKAVFEEPFSNSVLLRAVRKLIPVKPDAHEGSEEKPLTYRDIEILARPLRLCSYREFYLLSRLSRVLNGNKSRRVMNIWDQRILDNCPALRRFAGTIVVEVTK
jgi:2-polyprenyl-3-methyl-5-hydroxy-6-metoxy-1,4-benzoquinol methylase